MPFDEFGLCKMLMAADDPERYFCASRSRGNFTLLLLRVSDLATRLKLDLGGGSLDDCGPLKLPAGCSSQGAAPVHGAVAGKHCKPAALLAPVVTMPWRLGPASVALESLRSQRASAAVSAALEAELEAAVLDALARSLEAEEGGSEGRSAVLDELWIAGAPARPSLEARARVRDEARAAHALQPPAAGRSLPVSLVLSGMMDQQDLDLALSLPVAAIYVYNLGGADNPGTGHRCAPGQSQAVDAWCGVPCAQLLFERFAPPAVVPEVTCEDVPNAGRSEGGYFRHAANHRRLRGEAARRVTIFANSNLRAHSAHNALRALLHSPRLLDTPICFMPPGAVEAVRELPRRGAQELTGEADIEAEVPPGTDELPRQGALLGRRLRNEWPETSEIGGGQRVVEAWRFSPNFTVTARPVCEPPSCVRDPTTGTVTLEYSVGAGNHTRRAEFNPAAPNTFAAWVRAHAPLPGDGTFAPYCWRGIFSATAASLRRRTAAEYAALQRELERGGANPEAAHFVERAALYLFASH